VEEKDRDRKRKRKINLSRKEKEERDRTIEQLKKEIELIAEKETAEEQELNIIIERWLKQGKISRKFGVL
jgi:hypothetical protein